MGDYGLNAAQRQYDNAEPPRYNRKPVIKCSYCNEDICVGDDCFEIVGRIYCNECGEHKTLYAEDIEEWG